jgi:hypothetical protein
MIVKERTRIAMGANSSPGAIKVYPSLERASDQGGKVMGIDLL